MVYLTCDFEGSFKFFEVKQNSNLVTIRTGNISQSGITVTKSFTDNKSAQQFFLKTIAEKRSKGYKFDKNWNDDNKAFMHDETLQIWWNFVVNILKWMVCLLAYLVLLYDLSSEFLVYVGMNKHQHVADSAFQNSSSGALRDGKLNHLHYLDSRDNDFKYGS